MNSFISALVMTPLPSSSNDVKSAAN